MFSASNAALMLAELGDQKGALAEMQRIARRAPGSADMRAALAALYWWVAFSTGNHACLSSLPHWTEVQCMCVDNIAPEMGHSRGHFTLLTQKLGLLDTVLVLHLMHVNLHCRRAQGREAEAEGSWEFSCTNISVGCAKYQDADW